MQVPIDLCLSELVRGHESLISNHIVYLKAKMVSKTTLYPRPSGTSKCCRDSTPSPTHMPKCALCLFYQFSMSLSTRSFLFRLLRRPSTPPPPVISLLPTMCARLDLPYLSSLLLPTAVTETLGLDRYSVLKSAWECWWRSFQTCYYLFILLLEWSWFIETWRRLRCFVVAAEVADHECLAHYSVL